MISKLIQLILLFTVIIDPLLSYAFFFVTTKGFPTYEKKKIAYFAITVSGTVSLLFLLFGSKLLYIFNTNLEDFKIAGGIILSILGVRMALGKTFEHMKDAQKNSGRAISAIIGTPLMTGPACITAIIISSQEYGTLITGLAVGIVIAFTGMLLFSSIRLKKLKYETAIQVITTVLGIITISWGIGFIRAGLGF